MQDWEDGECRYCLEGGKGLLKDFTRVLVDIRISNYGQVIFKNWGKT